METFFFDATGFSGRNQKSTQGMVLQAIYIWFFSPAKGKWAHCYCIILVFALHRRLASFWEILWQTRLPWVILLLREDLAFRPRTAHKDPGDRSMSQSVFSIQL